VEKFKYLGVVFTSDGRRNEEIDRWIGKTNAVLCELYRSVVTKRELSNTAKLSLFKSVFSLILNYSHESCVMTEKLLSQVMGAINWGTRPPTFSDSGDIICHVILHFSLQVS